MHYSLNGPLKFGFSFNDTIMSTYDSIEMLRATACWNWIDIMVLNFESIQFNNNDGEIGMYVCVC